MQFKCIVQLHHAPTAVKELLSQHSTHILGPGVVLLGIVNCSLLVGQQFDHGLHLLRVCCGGFVVGVSQAPVALPVTNTKGLA
jgi:hypothetical protein